MQGRDDIHQQIQDDLLQLDFVACYAWQPIIELRLELDSILSNLVTPERYNRQNNPVDVDRDSIVGISFEYRSDIVNDLACAKACTLDLIKRGLRLVNFWILP